MSEMNIYNRTRDVFLHYNLPFDSPPPEAVFFDEFLAYVDEDEHGCFWGVSRLIGNFSNDR